MAAQAEDPTKYKYPMPFDPFTVLTVLVPGAGLFFTLPFGGLQEAAGGTVIGHAFQGPQHWYDYAAILVILFLVGASIDAIGRILRFLLTHGAALVLARKTPQLLLEELGHVLAFNREGHAPKLLEPKELSARLHELSVMATQVPRGKAFRSLDRTLAMTTNLVVAVGLASCWSPLADPGNPARVGGWPFVWLAALLLTVSALVVWHWWTALLFAASGVDLTGFQEVQRLEREEQRIANEKSIEARILVEVASRAKRETDENVRLKERLQELSHEHDLRGDGLTRAQAGLEKEQEAKQALQQQIKERDSRVQELEGQVQEQINNLHRLHDDTKRLVASLKQFGGSTEWGQLLDAFTASVESLVPSAEPETKVKLLQRLRDQVKKLEKNMGIPHR